MASCACDSVSDGAALLLYLLRRSKSLFLATRMAPGSQHRSDESEVPA